MEEKKGNNVTKLSDGEFLSFLYAERDRENSLTRYQGWNIWALVGAIAMVGCAGYHILKENVEAMAFEQVVCFMSGIFAILLCYRPVIFLFSKERGVDYTKIKLLKEVAPIPFLFLASILTVVFSILVPVFDKDEPWSCVSIGWMVSAVMFVSVGIMVVVNGNKIVKSYFDDMMFVNYKWEKWFSAVVSMVLCLVWRESFKRISVPLVGAPEFEFAICVVVIVLLIHILIKACISEKQANKIDVLIDEYVYKSASKDAIFLSLRINRMGHTVLETCANEIFAIGQSFDGFEKKKQQLEKTDEVLKTGNMDVDTFEKCVLEINEIRSYLSLYLQKATALRKKLLQVESQVPELKDDDEFKKLATIFNSSYENISSMVNLSKLITDKLNMWYKRYYCNKYGGFCQNDCKHRHDRKAFRLRLKMLRGQLTRKVKGCRVSGR